MITNNVKQAIRHLKKDKTNTLINILGLTLGLSIVTVVIVFLINELGYNKSVENRNRIYRVINYDESIKRLDASSPFILGEYAKEHIPGIESYTHAMSRMSIDIKKGTEFIEQEEAICLDAAFFDMFSVKILQGKVSDDFDKVENQILISKSLAYKYFGKQDVVGKNLIIKPKDSEKIMQIVGIFEDIPNNSSLKAKIIFNMKFAYEVIVDNVVGTGDLIDFKSLFYSWKGSQLSANYFLLKKNADAKEVEHQLAEIGKKYSNEDIKLNFSLQSLNDIYFGSKEIKDNTNIEKGNLNMVYILVLVGFLILIIACINYLNLSSAQAFMRIRNLSVNRVFGATRSNLIAQIITESALIAIVSLPIALILAYYLMPQLNEFLGHSYPLLINNEIALSLSLLIGITLLVGTLSGWLVSVRVTSFNIVETIKGKNMFLGDKFITRKLMISFQFAIFIVLLVVVLGVKKQVHYVINSDMGFNKEGLLELEKGDKNYSVFKNEILKNPNILSVSASIWTPPSNNSMDASVKQKSGKEILLRGNMVDYDFVKTMGLEILEGEDFDKKKHQSGVLLSKSAVDALEFEGSIIGKPMGFGKVVGVVSDFKMSSLHTETNPMMLMLYPIACKEIIIKVNTQNITETLAFLEKEWNKIEGTTPFQYQFTDDIVAELYKSDTQFSQIIGLLAFIAVFIASLGLFGLSVLMNKQRTKEIGIRKVNGATVTEVLTLLNRDFVKWVIVAFVIATPVAYYAMNKWLESFAYKTSLSWWIFALAGLSALVIALLTVSWQSWRTARRNPVEALRYE